MYLSRITFNPLVSSQQLANIFCQDRYKEHQALWRLFDTDPEAERDFLYRQTLEQGRVKYYVLSERQPVDTTGIWLVSDPKPYDPKLFTGQKLFFNLRANPIVTIRLENGRKERRDVVMNEKKRINFKELPKETRPLEQEIVQQTCIPWLAQRSKRLGFQLQPDTIMVDGYQQHESRSKNTSAAIRYSTVDFQGVLTVTEPETFKQTLFKGLGKARAFGCGLLLIKPI